MPKSYELISNSNANSNGKTDANLANDSLHLGGIPAKEYATEKYVRDYHDNKESDLKKYINSQDKAKLEEAKEYADSLVRNQDFSNFAKNKDIQALNETLTQKIKECHTNCETKIGKVVEDVNKNFDTVSQNIKNMSSGIDKDISDLDKKYDDLFQSVSDGKTKIAGAITDKGIETSATETFDNMANNIRNIQTGGGGGSGIDTSDATAIASDIKLGRTAYARGERITGTNTGVDLSQITPTYGNDTTGTTAGSGDILYGKTAYSNGKLITGTLINNEVEEIYGLEEQDYVVRILDVFEDFSFDGINYSLISKNAVGFSTDGTKIVRALKATINGKTNYFIASNTIDDSGIYFNMKREDDGSLSYRKWLWSFEELGLNINFDSLEDIYIGNPGFQGSNMSAALNIHLREHMKDPDDPKTTLNTYVFYFYRYNLDTGYIGYEYNSNLQWRWKKIVQSFHNITYFKGFINIVCSNLRPNIFAFCGFLEVGYYGDSNPCLYLLELFDFDDPNDNSYGYVSMTKSESQKTSVIRDTNIHQRGCFSSNDSFVYFIYKYTLFLFTVIKGEHYTIGDRISLSETDISGIGFSIFPNEKQLVSKGQLYDIISDAGVISFVKKSETEYFSTEDYNSSYSICNSGFSTNSDYFYLAVRSCNNDSSHYPNYLKIYKVNIDVEEPWKLIQEIPISTVSGGTYLFISSVSYPLEFNKDMTNCNVVVKTDSGEKLYRLNKKIDVEKIIGVKYKNQIFYDLTKDTKLTASSEDVLLDKTFIGSRGIVETGTREV